MKRSPHAFHRHTSESSADAGAGAGADPLEPLDAVVAVVDGAGVLPLELDEPDDWAPGSAVVPFEAIFGRADT